MLMLACIDGSGTINDSPVYVMAGYLASVEAWESFAAEWQTALDHPKAIKYFKMSEAWIRRGQFDGWDETMRDARLRMLPPIINRHAFSAVIFAVSSDGWKQHAIGRLNAPYHNRPYFFAFHTIMAAAVKYLASKGLNEKVDFVFDEEGGESTRLMLEGFEEWAALAPPHLKDHIGSPPIFRSEKEMLPLQAADLLAWHVRRSFFDGILGKDVSQLSAAMPELFEIEQARTLWNVEDIKRTVDDIVLYDFLISKGMGVSLTLPDPTSGPWL
jgi:Protein of unknown function (DUF3800)